MQALTRNESFSALILLLTVAAAVAWANVGDSYERFWTTDLAISFGEARMAHPLRDWVNSGLMTLFFVVIGLEARREFDLGDLRDRSRLVTPIVTGLLAMAVPALVFLTVTAGSPEAARGWGVAISTDTAFALGIVGLLGVDGTARLRVFLLTVLVVDDLVSVLVAAFVYSDGIDLERAALALAGLVVFAVMLRLGVDQPVLYAVMGFAIWACLFGSGIDPVLAGLAIGLLAAAHPPRRESLERATRTFRVFREEPTVELARSATDAVTATQSPNDRLRRFYLPWTSLVIVPIFGLANAGARLVDGGLTHALGSPVFWGIVVAYVIGKPLAYLVATLALHGIGRDTPAPVGSWGMAAVGMVAAAPFTLSLLIADRAFTGAALNDARLAILASLVGAAASALAIFSAIDRLPDSARARAMQGDGVALSDLCAPVDEAIDHIRGAVGADVTIVEYGDFECPHCGRAEVVARAELSADDRVRYVWRHLPLHAVHPHAQLAAEAAEAASAQGAFWPMHDRLLDAQQKLTREDLIAHADALGLDVERFADDLDSGRYADRVDRDIATADAGDITGTPTFFVNGRRHYGGYDVASIREAVTEARARSLAALDRGGWRPRHKGESQGRQR